MSVRSITLTPAHLACLVSGRHVWTDDSERREVLLYVSGARPADVYDGALEVDLSKADLSLIAEPEGLVVADTTGATGWTVLSAAPVPR